MGGESKGSKRGRAFGLNVGVESKRFSKKRNVLEEVQKEVLDTAVSNTLEDTPNLFRIEYAKSNRAKCKQCRKAIQKKALRIGKLIKFKNKLVTTYYHVDCAFLASRRARNPENIIDKIEKIDGIDSITVTEKREINALIDKYSKETIKHLNKLSHHACYNEMLNLITYFKERKK